MIELFIVKGTYDLFTNKFYVAHPNLGANIVQIMINKNGKIINCPTFYDKEQGIFQ